jgi:hypothetical protein
VFAAGLVLAFALAGCTGAAGGGRHPSARAQAPSQSGRLDPRVLLGSWRVAAPAATGVLVRFDGALTVRSGCGVMWGSWDADEYGLFAAALYGGVPQCSLPRIGQPRWLARAVGFEPAGADRLLLDQAGRVIARLLPVARPTAFGFASPVAQVESRFDAGRPLPGGLRAATAATLVGRWLAPPSDRAVGGAPSFLDFRADGTWSSSDGCNGNGGRWALGPDGALVSSLGPSTLVLCAGSPTAGWLQQASRAGLAGRTLTLFAPSGQVVGRLTRA